MKKILLSLVALVGSCFGMSAGTQYTDELTVTSFDVSGTSYVNATYTADSESGSGIVYSAYMAGGNNSIQLRSSNNNSGIVVTKNDKNLTLLSITVEYNSNTTSGRVVNIYESNEAYTAPSDLYKTGLTTAGTIAYNNPEKFISKTSSNFFGVRSSSNALYINKITVVWEDNNGDTGKNPNLLFSKETYNATIGETFEKPELSNPFNVAVTYGSSDTDVATVSEDGDVTILKVGETVITASFAGNDEYAEGSASYTLIVNKIVPVMTFSDQVVFGKYPVGVVWKPVSVTKPVDEKDRGPITYSSSDPTIVSINSETGAILPATQNEDGELVEGDVHGAGEVTITASMEETETCTGGTATYKIIIKDPNGEIQPGTSKFDFTVENPYDMTTYSASSGNVYETKVTEIVADGIVTLAFEGEYRSWKNTDGTYELRVNKAKASKFTINVPDGYTLTAIGMVGKQLKGSYTPAGDNNSSDMPSEWDDVNLTWHAAVPATVEDAITSVSFDNSNAATSQISTIWVQYQAAGANLESADLSFGKVVNDILVNEEATINAVINPNKRPISYAIANLDESEYTITPSEDGTTMKVLVNRPGFYTLEATSPADDHYRDGYAIMRLNVYRHLDVYANDVEVTDEKINTAEDVTVTFRVPDFAKVYWQVIDDADPTATVEPGDEDDEDLEPGFTLYEDPVQIKKGLDGKLVFYIANYGYSSPKRTILLGDPEIVPVPEFAEGEYELDGDYIKATGTVKLNFKSVDGYHIYYSVTSNASVSTANLVAKAACADTHDGFTKHGGEDIELNSSHVALSFYACNPETGVHSELKTYNLSVETGIEAIDADEAGNAVYFNMQGVKVANPENGLYIRVINGKADKVVILK